MNRGMTDARPLIIARSSSHFSRATRIFAYELDVPFDFRAVLKLTSEDPEEFGGNPSLKVPVLVHAGESWFGTLNVCRQLWRISGKRRPVLWPEGMETALLANALEVTLNGMGAEVAIVMNRLGDTNGTPAEGRGLQKTRAGLLGSVAWLEARLPEIQAALPSAGTLSYFEVLLFCFAGHLEYREVLNLAPYEKLCAFRDEFAKRPSARATEFNLDG
jgi:glutathione S-transferase